MANSAAELRGTAQSCQERMKVPAPAPASSSVTGRRRRRPREIARAIPRGPAPTTTAGATVGNSAEAGVDGRRARSATHGGAWEVAQSAARSSRVLLRRAFSCMSSLNLRRSWVTPPPRAPPWLQSSAPAAPGRHFTPKSKNGTKMTSREQTWCGGAGVGAGIDPTVLVVLLYPPQVWVKRNTEILYFRSVQNNSNRCISNGSSYFVI